MRRQNYLYSSIFSKEMTDYIKLRRESGKYTAKTESTLKDLDAFLVDINLNNKVISHDILSEWQKTRTVCAVTKHQDCAHVNGFCSYLNTLGIEAAIAEKPKFKSEYVPYIFNSEEIERIIFAADNCQTNKKLTRASTIFPVLLRILYGCGLRLGEGLNLLWNDIDLPLGVIYLRNTKSGKARCVPMDSTLTEILVAYRKLTQEKGICTNYLFESYYREDTPMRNNTFWRWFSDIMKSANVQFVKQSSSERGPCAHCLRHTFAHNSFLKSYENDLPFDDFSHYLEAYLGHNSILETQAYLRSSYTVYIQTHERLNKEIGNIFPEVLFNEEQ